MFRAIALISLSVLLVSAIGFALCRALGWNVSIPALATAGGACVVASLLACIPLILVRGEPQASQAQAALLGTVIHMFFAAAVAAAVLILKFNLPGSFIYWLFAFYWTTLIVLASSFIRTIKQAPTAPPTPQAKPQ
jgi:hypothetical protein